MKDQKRFAKNLTALADVFDVELGATKIGTYWSILEVYEDDVVESALKQCARTMERFPKPVHIIELIEGKNEDRAMIAWDYLLTAIQRHGSGKTVLFADGKIGKAVELMGGWWQVCLWTVDETKWRMADFVKIYKSLGPCEPKKLIGRYEQENALRGFLDRPHEAVLIGGTKSLQIEDGP